MSAIAQVAHVLAKDLRQTRWLVALFAATVLVATLRALGWSPSFNGGLDALVLAVIGLGMLLVASSIQADSPTNPKAFWAAHPIAPYSVLSAKMVLTLVVVIGLPAIGQAVGLVAHGVPGAAVPRIVWQSAAGLGTWLLFAMIVAALTKDLRSFLLIVIGVPLVLFVFLFTILLPRLTNGNDAALAFDVKVPWQIWLIIGVGGSLALLVILYRRRGLGRPAWILAVLAMLGLANMQGVIGAGGPGPDVTYNGPRATAELSLADAGSLARGTQFDVLLTVTSPSMNERLSLVSPRATLYSRGDSVMSISLSDQSGTIFSSVVAVGASGASVSSSASTLLSPTTALPSNPRWLGGPGSPTIRRQLSSRLTAPQLAKLATVDSVVLDAALAVDHPSVVGTLPLTVGATMTRGPMHALVRSWTQAGGTANVSVDVQSIPYDDHRSSARLFGVEPIDFALWNPARNEALVLDRRSTHGGSEWLVIPGASVELRGADLEPSFRGVRGESIANEWFDQARLVLIEWTELGTYPIRVGMHVGKAAP